MASAPPPIISQRRRRLRASDASASAAQSGPCEPPLPPGPHWGPPCPKLMGRILEGGGVLVRCRLRRGAVTLARAGPSGAADPAMPGSRSAF
ncbi:hypothetical protein EOT10_33015 [Streptomyces antnestii]|uniref:Uncharacterized protein n=1 Tax=Streptomyces antnestii TaxID=2494256 RepID=A0A3S2WAH5_9ACTN|nr:hypothetical protein EOT10_33015 [Streptomyces sp. San01]